MNHHEIEQQEIIERYIMHRLPAAQRLTFQEHFFGCDECFEKIQSSSKFIAGVKENSRLGYFPEFSTKRNRRVIFIDNLFKPAFALASAIALVLAFVLGWLLLRQIPKLREEVAFERKAREQISNEKDQSLQVVKDELEKERQALALTKAEQEKFKLQIEQQVAQTKPLLEPVGQVEANASIVLLEAQRDAKAESNVLKIPSSSNVATLWIELAPDPRFTTYQLQIFDDAKKLITTVNGAKLNSYGALAVNVPALNFKSGKYVVKAFGSKGEKLDLIGEYKLSVLRN